MPIRAVPHRNTMSPPQLAADAPILDVFHPVVISLLEALGHNFDASIFYGFERSFSQRLNGHKPLFRDHRLDNFAAALRTRDGRSIRFSLDDETGGFHICPEI